MVKRYYAALVSGDGATACSLLTARLARSLAMSLSHASGKRAKGCPGIMTLLFKHQAGQNDSALSKVEVVDMRVKGNRGFALLRSGAASEIPLVREGGQWKVGSLIGGSL